MITPTRKDKFYEKWGLDPNRPFYTYLTSSNSIAGSERGAVEQWRDAMRGKQLVVRAHPDKLHLMSDIKGVIAIPRVSEGVFTDQAFQLAYDTYYYSEACHAINTSAFIEAMLVGTPCYALNIENQSETAIGGQSGIHFQQLLPLLDGSGPKKIKKWLGVDKKMPSELVLQAINDIIKE